MVTTNTARIAFGSTAAVLALLAGSAQADERDSTFSIDVAADCNRFITEGTPHPANPGFGAYFMQEGIIYRPGTFAKHCPVGNGCGLRPDGTPEFPKAVIGKWTCWGSFVGKGGATPAGVWLYSTQVYEFDVEQIDKNVYAPGKDALVSHGPERIDENSPWDRAITGGYGRFRRAVGEVAQTKIGFNKTECENFTFAFDIQPRRAP